MSIISKLFGKSPFEPLYQHMCKVKKCVDLIKPLMRAFFDEDFEKVTEITKKIFKAEHEADQSRIYHAFVDFGNFFELFVYVFL